MEPKAWWELASDCAGFLSAILLLVPTLYTSAARVLVWQRKKEILERYRAEGREPTPRSLAKLRAAEDAAASLFRAQDRWMIVGGLWLLFASFLFKLIYHYLDKL